MVLCIGILITLGLVLIFRKPYTAELSVEDGIISWGEMPEKRVEIQNISKIIHDKRRGVIE